MNIDWETIVAWALVIGVIIIAIRSCLLMRERIEKKQKAAEDAEYEVWRNETQAKIAAAQEQAKARVEVTAKVEVPPKAEVETPVETSAKVPRYVQQAQTFAHAARAMQAYHEGTGLVEAYFFAKLAQLGGHRQIAPLLSEIRITWRRVGCPDEKERVHDDFGELESAIGRACLRRDTGVQRDLGEACLRDLANDGEELAKVLLGE